MNTIEYAHRVHPSLPDLPLKNWEETKTTLHLYIQIIGKIRLALMPRRNHWWHVPLYVASRGLTTRPIPYRGIEFEISFDFIDHVLRITTSEGDHREITLRGQSVGTFYNEVFTSLATLGIEVQIRAVPYEHQSTIPFAEDETHGSYDRQQVDKFFKILVWTDGVFQKFSGRFLGKTSPVHLFWHSFDLTVTRFSGRRAPEMTGASRVNREAYSHEVVSFGFWAGDEKIPEPAFYSYTAPEPQGLREEPLAPSEAFWGELNGGTLALYRYSDILNTEHPEESLLQFLESAYQAGARRAVWETADER